MTPSAHLRSPPPTHVRSIFDDHGGDLAVHVMCRYFIPRARTSPRGDDRTLFVFLFIFIEELVDRNSHTASRAFTTTYVIFYLNVHDERYIYMM